mmetsp:Transcript_73922/g.149499  ORF Transcript_73922/g.149499 Transcript_73922/m.149499 type:complete len:91 (+) Transcript_73922:359-631(+)
MPLPSFAAGGEVVFPDVNCITVPTVLKVRDVLWLSSKKTKKQGAHVLRQKIMSATSQLTKRMMCLFDSRISGAWCAQQISANRRRSAGRW